MNRLIIIGNGFDLAHGLKTSFKDFIADYLFNVITEFAEKDQYDDKLISLNYTGKGKVDLDCNFVEESLDLFRLIKKSEKINFKFNSPFFQKVFNQINIANWVDIEIEYYQVLKGNKRGMVEMVKKLNEEFLYLKEMLFKYLKRQEEGYNKRIYSNDLLECFNEDFNKDEMLVPYVVPKISKILFLNFNYTNILEKYFRMTDGTKEVNYIHGNLKGDLGEAIFGFGDEFDEHYSVIEGYNENEFFKHIKSFEYSKNQNYFTLMRFIGSGDYQVQIYGHSCGLSDRTMLNKIFENEKCKSIKIFYYGDEQDNDFIDKLNNISRHFKDKTLLREKVVPLDMCRPMPQPAVEYKLIVNGQLS
jgi:hypothetical protein